MVDDPFDWKTWRRGERARLIAERKSLERGDRKTRNAAIDGWLDKGFPALGGLTIGFCWPFAAEPEPRFAVRRWRAMGSRAALPVVVAPGMPLEFREWWPGMPMKAGVYDIPYPVGSDRLLPQAAIVPVNGFDQGGYRLGYGGGYFDRTLAGLPIEPIKVGLGYELARLETIHPQPHDIPFDFIVTEAGIFARLDDRLSPVDPSGSIEHLRELIRQRRIIAA